MANTTRPRLPQDKQFAPFANAVIVTPSDTVDISTGTASQLYVGGTGNINVIMEGGQTVLFSAVPVGTKLDLRVTRVMLTSTTATLIVALN